ncbi:MAG TPA: hypothetical protein VLM38_20815 [Blastocatellia bacterium]|nr:hypothetical protein [Blastocatellia bacterium]
MKRIVRLLAMPVVLTSAAAPAYSFGLTGSLCRTLSAVIEASTNRLKTPRVFSADFAISKFSGPGMVDAFQRAWRRAGNGLSFSEGVVLILKMADGSVSAREMGATNEYKQFTFGWHPATIAVVHTHPNSSNPKPQDHDVALADKYRVPVFTITSRGMWVYDPSTRKITKVREDLDWLDQKHWAQQVAVN